MDLWGTERDIIEWEPQSSYLMELSVSTIILKKEALYNLNLKHLKSNTYPINTHLRMPVTVCKVGLGIRGWAESCESIAYAFLCTVRIIPAFLEL